MKANDFIDDEGMRIPDDELSPSQLAQRLEAMSAHVKSKQEKAQKEREYIARLKFQALYSGIEKAAEKVGKNKIKQMSDKQIKKALE